MNELNKEQHKYREKPLYKAQPYLKDDAYPACQCTFCGAALEEDERFCSECGNPRDGIRCPRCGTMSRRSFCSRCNTPLNELASEALAKAKADPMFQQAEKLAVELSELEKQIRDARVRPAATLDTSVKSETLKEAERYASLFSGVSSMKLPDAPVAVSKPSSNVVTGDLLAKAQEAYKQKAAELQRALDAMLPPASATPEEKRNFFCARLIKTVEWVSEGQVWVCNYCGCHHKAPSECVKPQLGGKWIVSPIKVEHTKTSVMYD